MNYNFYEEIKRVVRSEKMEDGTFIYTLSNNKEEAKEERDFIIKNYEIEWEKDDMIKIKNI